MKISRLTAVLTLFVAALHIASAQNGTMTPYSLYGLGVLRDHATSTQRAMGGIGYAMNSGRQINAMNPASYAARDTLTFLFDMGIEFTKVWNEENQRKTIDEKLTDNWVKGNKTGGGLDYVTMQFPLGKYMGGSVGLVPYSSVGYAFGDKIQNGTYTQQGSGSLNEVYVGVAGKIYKGLTIGANISYLFGTLLHENYVTSSTAVTLYQKQIEVRDYHLVFGAQYSLPIGANVLTAGLTFSPGKDLLGNYRQVNIDNGQDSEPQFSESTKLKGNYSLPSKWGAGINYRLGRKLMMEFDFTYQPWKDAKNKLIADDPDHRAEYCDRTRYAFGAEWMPNWRGGYFERVNYRVGAYYNNDYLKLQNNRLREYGLTAGFGFPVPAFKTTINLGFEWMHRYGAPNGTIKENYLNITLGINFNEMWFRQSKIY